MKKKITKETKKDIIIVVLSGLLALLGLVLFLFTPSHKEVSQIKFVKLTPVAVANGGMSGRVVMGEGGQGSAGGSGMAMSQQEVELKLQELEKRIKKLEQNENRNKTTTKSL